MPSFLRLSAIYPHPANSLWLLIKHQFLSLISMVDLNIFQTSSSMLPYHVASPVLRYFIDPFVSFTELQFPTLAPPVKLPSFRVCFPVCQALPSLGSAPWPSSRREQQRFFFPIVFLSSHSVVGASAAPAPAVLFWAASH